MQVGGAHQPLHSLALSGSAIFDGDGNRKSARSLRRFFAGCRSARSNIQLSTQIEHEPSPVDACGLLHLSRIAIGQCAGSSRLRSAASSAAIKSP
jgi:hypothetical protein